MEDETGAMPGRAGAGSSDELPLIEDDGWGGGEMVHFTGVQCTLRGLAWSGFYRQPKAGVESVPRTERVDRRWGTVVDGD
ncbi:MAG: hypothetical protein CME88_04205 [Hirschia sp.]|nr:hypothetical protein [Hirschia sp.]MBF17562.1 hypothetical protein [Hirschia sp.]